MFTDCDTIKDMPKTPEGPPSVESGLESKETREITPEETIEFLDGMEDGEGGVKELESVLRDKESELAKATGKERENILEEITELTELISEFREFEKAGREVADQGAEIEYYDDLESYFEKKKEGQK